jgi:hypothetical protein
VIDHDISLGKEIDREEIDQGAGMLEASSARVGCYSAEVGLAEVGTTESRHYFRMLLSPRVPFLNAAFESLNLFLICHRDLLVWIAAVSIVPPPSSAGK